MRALMATMFAGFCVVTGCGSGTAAKRTVDSGVDADQTGIDGNPPDLQPDRPTASGDAPVANDVADTGSIPADAIAADAIAADTLAADSGGNQDSALPSDGSLAGDVEGGAVDHFSANDTSSLVDLGTDIVSQDGSTTWCASSTHMFCADFDRSSYETDWSASVKIGGGQLGPTMTTASSPPSALLSSLPLPPNAPDQARIEKRFLPRPTEARLEFDVLIQDPRSDAAVRAGPRADIFSIFQEASQVLTGIKMVRGGSSTDTTYVCVQRTVIAGRQDCGSFFGQAVHDPIPVGRWAHVALLYNFPGIPVQTSPGSIDLKVDGISVVSYKNVINADAVVAMSTSTVFSLGLVGGVQPAGSSSPGGQISAAYDNVTLDLVW